MLVLAAPGDHRSFIVCGVQVMAITGEGKAVKNVKTKMSLEHIIEDTERSEGLVVHLKRIGAREEMQDKCKNTEIRFTYCPHLHLAFLSKTLSLTIFS